MKAQDTISKSQDTILISQDTIRTQFRTQFEPVLNIVRVRVDSDSGSCIYLKSFYYYLKSLRESKGLLRFARSQPCYQTATA